MNGIKLTAAILLMATGSATAASPLPGRPVGTKIEREAPESGRLILNQTSAGIDREMQQRPAPISGQQRPISRTSLSGAQLHTWLGGSETDVAGWYSFDTDGSYRLEWSNEIYASMGINITNGWMRDNRLCGLGVMNMGGMIFYYNYVEFDPVTGQMLKEEGLAPNNQIDMGTYYISCAYVPEEDRIYGYTSTTEENGYNFCSSPAGNIADITVIKHLEDYSTRTNSLCYNAEEGALYGVTFNGDFVKIDFEGNQTKIFTLPLEDVRNDKAALVYSPYDGCYLYTPSYYYYATQLYYVYPEEKQIRFVRNYPGSEQFFFFTNDNFTFNADAPGRPTFVSDRMTPGALEGEWTLKMPVATAGGAALSGNLTWTLYIDNTASSTGSATPGEEIDIKVGPLSNGEHVIRVSCADASGHEGLPYVVDRYFGNGVPLAPAEVTMTETSVSWTPVTEALLGGYLEPGKMRYEVYVNDRFIGSTDGTSMAIELDPDVTVSAYYAYVAATCNGQVSERTKSNKTIFGSPLALPYTVVPTAEQADICRIFNVDGSPDYGTWEFYETRWHEPVFASGWSRQAADDWLILPPVDCSDITHAYKITLDAICGGLTGKDERFEVWCGNAPDPKAMNTLIIPETQVTEFITAGWETFSNLFVPKQPGATYVAIRAVSPADQHSLIVRRIIIEPTEEPANVPEAPVNFTVIDKDDASLTATVTLVMPDKTIAGTDIPADANLIAHVGIDEKWDERKAQPGEKLTLTIDTYQGDNRLVAYCTLDGQRGQEANANIFTGTIPPNFVENFDSEVSRDNMSVTMTWDAPVRGQENLEGYYSPEGMHYWLMEQQPDEYGAPQWVPTKNLGDVHEYTYTLPEGEPLQVKYVGIAAANNGGISDAIYFAYRQIGPPYSGEIHETFIVGNEPGINYTPLLTQAPDDSYTNLWLFVMPEEFGADLWNPDIPYAMGCATAEDEESGKGRLQLPKFSTENVKDPGLTLTLWTSAPCLAPVSVYAMTYGTRMAKIAEIPASDKGWQDIIVPMPEIYRDMPWIQLAIDSDLPDYYTWTLIGGYRFGTVDLSATDAPAVAKPTVFGGRGEIIFYGAEGEKITVYSLDGTILAHNWGAHYQDCIHLPAGTYIVMIGENVQKVIVR